MRGSEWHGEVRRAFDAHTLTSPCWAEEQMQEREAVRRGPRRAAPERTPREARDMPLQRHVPLAGNTARAEWSEPPAVNPSSRSREDRCRVSEPGWGPERTPDRIRGRASGVLGPRGRPRSGGTPPAHVCVPSAPVPVHVASSSGQFQRRFGPRMAPAFCVASTDLPARRPTL